MRQITVSSTLTSPNASMIALHAILAVFGAAMTNIAAYGQNRLASWECRPCAQGPGLLASVSFCGHRLAGYLKCAEALVTMILSSKVKLTKLDARFPNSSRLTPSRIGTLQRKGFRGRRNFKPPPNYVNVCNRTSKS